MAQGRSPVRESDESNSPPLATSARVERCELWCPQELSTCPRTSETRHEASSPWRTFSVAPRSAQHPYVPAVFDPAKRQAQRSPCGMQRRSNAAGLSPRAARPARQATRFIRSAASPRFTASLLRCRLVLTQKNPTAAMAIVTTHIMSDLPTGAQTDALATDEASAMPGETPAGRQAAQRACFLTHTRLEAHGGPESAARSCSVPRDGFQYRRADPMVKRTFSPIGAINVDAGRGSLTHRTRRAAVAVMT